MLTSEHATINVSSMLRDVLVLAAIVLVVVVIVRLVEFEEASGLSD
jgi:hypothetical protein